MLQFAVKTTKMDSCNSNILISENKEKIEGNVLQWTVIETAEIETVDKFWSSIHILNKNLHVVLPRVCGSVGASCAKLLSPMSLTTISLGNIMSLNLAENAEADDILKQVKCCGLELETVEDLDVCDEDGCYVTVQKLILKVPTNVSSFWILTFKDYATTEVIFLLLNSSDVRSISVQLKLSSIFPFKFAYEDHSLKLLKFISDGGYDCYWLKNTLFAKVLKWACSASSLKPTIKSLSLIAIDEYVKLYHNLKQKYGSHMVKIWPERTDPQKFVYEDIAIATYLLLLWSKQRQEHGRAEWMQSFVDLGCGNGLLVYILSSEGHIGKGLDIRKRAIWDCYPQSTLLQVDTITPSDNFLFPDTDWIIGNHSDELTPWIPVIAARSSYKCSFFLLPCCLYDFNGSKYQRQNTTLSQYADYLEYLKYICKICGFETQTDRLKIPSTKRICLIGSKRTYIDTESNKILADIEQLIKSKNGERGNKTNDGDHFTVTERADKEWISGFKARDAVERVRNCTQLDGGIRDQIVNLVTKLLLAKHHHLIIISDDGSEKTWNAGDVMSISEIATAIPASLMQQLKNECGGLQTLLKNNHHIFFVSDGKVQFRTPENIHSKSGKSKKRKRKRESTVLKCKIKPCWFHNNHPDGCPLPGEICTFKH